MKAQRINNRILVADDERSARLLLCQFLSKKGYETYEATDGQEAVSLVEKYTPNILLLDFSMPGLNGLEVIREIQQNGNFPLLYTILLSGYSDPQDEERALKAGVNAFLAKPCDLTVLMNLIRTGIGELEQKRAIYLDSLTHIYTAEQAPRFLAKMQAAIENDDQEPGANLIFDLDHFQQINQTFGHEVGDRVIAQFAELLGEVTRKNDIPCRVGGDRFLVLLPETGKSAAMMIGDRVLSRMQELPLPDGLKLSVTVGGAQYKGSGQDMFDEAEKALAQAKSEGRGTILFFD